MWWPEDQYAWFFVPGVAGGTDAYAETMDDLDRSCVIAEASGVKAEGLSDLLERSLRIGRQWYFRRSMGQPGIINVAYGIIAASLAELTNGFLDSTDGGWDYRLLPARPAEFLKWYFRPELATDDGEQEWSQRCIRGLREELEHAAEDSPH